MSIAAPYRAPTMVSKGHADRLAQLEDLYREHYGPSVRLAHMLIGDRGRAEELTQDAFVKLLPKLDMAQDPAAYLRRILVNGCRDAGRRATRAKAHPVPAAATSPPPDLPADTSEVWQALQGLPERQRAALALRYYADLPTNEVAKILGARPATVRSLVHRGIANLREVVPHEQT